MNLSRFLGSTVNKRYPENKDLKIKLSSINYYYILERSLTCDSVASVYTKRSLLYQLAWIENEWLEARRGTPDIIQQQSVVDKFLDSCFSYSNKTISTVIFLQFQEFWLC